MSAAALHLAATRAGADGWTFPLDVLMLVGIGFVSDPWSPMAQLWPAVRAGFRREPLRGPITISTRAMAVRAGRCLIAGLAATGAALSVECSVQWSAFRMSARVDMPVLASRRIAGVQIDLGLRQHSGPLVVRSTTMLPRQAPGRSPNSATSLSRGTRSSHR
ncbi:hypothetical protein ABZ915_45685 [Streptomyces sp. NPDC046915]|uniref:hypothetical protein n=1 Tax=Streptomyces sp. NPDC046915 TaxID=3155257 RepID=UPI0033CEE40C